MKVTEIIPLTEAEDDKGKRIDIIRSAIVKHGGARSFTHYADGPKGMGHATREKGVVKYKIDRRSDSLTPSARQSVVDELKKHPDVKDAYLSRPYAMNFGYEKGRKSSGHIMVIFHNKAEKAKKGMNESQDRPHLNTDKLVRDMHKLIVSDNFTLRDLDVVASLVIPVIKDKEERKKTIQGLVNIYRHTYRNEVE